VLHIHLHVLPRQAGDKLSFAKGMLLRRDPDREETGRICATPWRNSTPLHKTDCHELPRPEGLSEFLRFHDNVYQRTNGWIGHG
jgi:hypothetical protein